jgi:hypothetical protein
VVVTVRLSVEVVVVTVGASVGVAVVAVRALVGAFVVTVGVQVGMQAHKNQGEIRGARRRRVQTTNETYNRRE